MKLIRTSTLFVITLFVAAAISACGGGGGSDGSGMLIEGSLTEGGGAGHSRDLTHAHAVGEKIGMVKICALGECSTTDEQGQWGFVAPDSFDGGDVEFSIDGHGILTTSVVRIPAGANEVFIHFQHVEGGAVEVHHMMVDGQRLHAEEHGEHAHN